MSALEYVVHLAVIVGIIYSTVLFFVFLGSRSMFGRKETVKYPFVFAVPITIMILFIIIWGGIWGNLAWPAFFLFVLIISGSIYGVVQFRDWLHDRR